MKTHKMGLVILFINIYSFSSVKRGKERSKFVIAKEKKKENECSCPTFMELSSRITEENLQGLAPGSIVSKG